MIFFHGAPLTSSLFQSTVMPKLAIILELYYTNVEQGQIELSLFNAADELRNNEQHFENVQNMIAQSGCLNFRVICAHVCNTVVRESSQIKCSRTLLINAWCDEFPTRLDHLSWLWDGTLADRYKKVHGNLH